MRTELFVKIMTLLALAAVLVAGPVFLASCAKGSKKGPLISVVKDCVLPDDQKFSLQGRWMQIPVKLSFYVGEWSPEEIEVITKAAKTWNEFFSNSRGITVFDVGPGGGYQSSAVQTSPQCGSSSTISDGTVIYKRASLWTKGENAVALTTVCTQNVGAPTDGTLSPISNAIMEFNYKNFFISGMRLPDLESIAVHELGHLLGLDHSCGALSFSKAGFPNASCPDPKVDPGNFILQTVMFPQVFFDESGAGEVKSALHANDQGRANCLYEAK